MGPVRFLSPLSPWEATASVCIARPRGLDVIAALARVGGQGFAMGQAEAERDSLMILPQRRGVGTVRR